MKFVIRENIFVFTNINLLLFALCYYRPIISYINYINYINYDYLYSICYCWNYIIFLTFNGAYCMDNTCFKRMAQRKNMSSLIFHSGNFILHWIPFIYVNIYIPKNITLQHSLIACISNLVWCYWATFGTFDIDFVYVSIEKEKQLKLYLINISSIFYVPLIFHINKQLCNSLLC